MFAGNVSMTFGNGQGKIKANEDCCKSVAAMLQRSHNVAMQSLRLVYNGVVAELQRRCSIKQIGDFIPILCL